jgi:hypothetical protein
MKLSETIPAELQAKVGKDFLKGKPGMTAKYFDITTAPIEPNTEWESEIISNLRSWGNTATNDRADFFFKLKPELDLLAKKYPFIKYSSNSYLYRGTSIRYNVDQIAKKCIEYLKTRDVGNPITIFDDFDRKFLMYRIPIKTIFKGNRNAQSWSAEYEVAGNFVRFSDTRKGYLPCLLQIPGNSPDLYFPWNIADAYKFSSLADAEKEVIRISDKPIKCTHLIVSPDSLKSFDK